MIIADKHHFRVFFEYFCELFVVWSAPTCTVSPNEPYSVSVPDVPEFIPPWRPGTSPALPPTPPSCGSVHVTGGCCAGGAEGPGGVVNHISLAGCPVAAARGRAGVVTGGGF